jgi:hypothetical protein
VFWPGCKDSGDEPGLRSFDLEAEPFAAEPSLEVPELPTEWTAVDAVVISAPSSVEEGSTFPVEIELRNRSFDPIDLEPCPVWLASIGESSEVSNVEGALPCSAIGTIDGGERIRLKLQMPATEFAVTNEGGEYASLVWLMRGDLQEQTRASIAVPMTRE